MKDLLRRLFAATLRELDPGVAMVPVLAHYRERARGGGRFLVLAYGKAARAMAQAVATQLAGARLRGLVVPPEPDDAPLPPFEVIAGGHPLPSEGSLRAGQRALELARSVQQDETVLFLASGGGSAMLEWPIDESMTLAELQVLHRALVGSGAFILNINGVRKHLSAVKGGRLALAAAAAGEHATITMSDLPYKCAEMVASGPSHPEDTDGERDRLHRLGWDIRTLDRYALWPSVPERLHARLRSGSLSSGSAAGYRTPNSVTVIGSNDVARRAVALAVKRAGVHVIHDTDQGISPYAEDWSWQVGAQVCVARLDQLRHRWPGRPVAVISGGELSVPLPANPGTGGRNQQFALACARWIRGRPITVLSCGTDGIDGNSPAAGAIVDGTTMVRARALGLDVHTALRDCDAFPLLHALGDTVVTGPTGTNVRDLRLLVHRG